MTSKLQRLINTIVVFYKHLGSYLHPAISGIYASLHESTEILKQKYQIQIYCYHE